jgi:dihydroneopterin aldolase / 2-amino-4-hydroxy-6-hydroxymethyldihydropteridine diphosphokinase / dihydropteroate synthase
LRHKIQTNIEPLILLFLLKKIEAAVGRAPSVRNGPRVVDLDILLYDADMIDTRAENDKCDLVNLEGHLIVPHPRMKEREFVLRPLNE